MLPHKTYKKLRSNYTNNTDSVNTGVHNTHINTNHYYTLLNTITASGQILSSFIIVSKTHINKFNIPTYYRFTSNDTDAPLYQHKQLKYYVTCTMNGSLTDVIMKQYIDRVVANSEQIIHLFLDYASTHRNLPIRLHCSMKHVQLHHIPANTTHILQVNDLVVFVQLKEHLSHMHNRLITEQQTTTTRCWIRSTLSVEQTKARHHTILLALCSKCNNSWVEAQEQCI